MWFDTMTGAVVVKKQTDKKTIVQTLIHLRKCFLRELPDILGRDYRLLEAVKQFHLLFRTVGIY